MGVKLKLHEDLASFRCPGCVGPHAVSIKHWVWNGDLQRPTFTSSILEKSGHFARAADTCWCTYNAERPDDPAPFSCHACHSFVTDGRIQFLGDCTHKLAGQTVEIPDWE